MSIVHPKTKKMCLLPPSNF